MMRGMRRSQRLENEMGSEQFHERAKAP
jgi:hypothetical protein